MNQQILIYVVGVFAFLTIVWAIFLEARLRKVFGGKKPGDLENILREIARELQALHGSREDMEKYLESVEKRLNRSAQHVGIVRFNPFKDAGGDQSFALAIMDERKNGIVLSSLYGRDTSRIYAKPLDKGTSTYKLSNEELQAVEDALRKS
ncbi:DUF4446 family protein [Candidatus Giovannonibacteria bacterium]|nr:DUF4446 family protein [Candidatus Giovannonibacteria bacterium]